MATDDKKGWKKLKISPTSEDSDNPGTDPKEKEDGEEQDEAKPAKYHTSQGHATEGEGTGTSTHEPTLRAATTDSSRVPKSSNDENPTGGNVR